jgi:hypothetical protein
MGGSRVPRWVPQPPSYSLGRTGESASGAIRLQHGWDHFPFGIQDLTLCRRHQSDHNQSNDFVGILKADE